MRNVSCAYFKDNKFQICFEIWELRDHLEIIPLHMLVFIFMSATKYRRKKCILLCKITWMGSKISEKNDIKKKNSFQGVRSLKSLKIQNEIFSTSS